MHHEKRHDPIIEELRWIREKIGKAKGLDVRRIAAAIRQHEDVSGKGVVREPKRPAGQQKASVDATGSK